MNDGISQAEGHIRGLEERSAGHKDYDLPCGWALKTPSKRTPHNPAVRAYIQAIFDLGEATKEKANAVKVAQDMRAATDDNGNLLFEEKYNLIR